jgi:hypothetical protein
MLPASIVPFCAVLPKCLFAPPQPVVVVRFEKKYDPIPVLEWMRDHPIVPIVAVMAYAGLIFGGQYLMKDREAWNLRGIMAFWNLSLSVFSWIGMFRTLPQLLHNLYFSSLRDNVCLDRKFCFAQQKPPSNIIPIH